MKPLLVPLLTTLILSVSIAAAQPVVAPIHENYVQDAKTAVAIAEAVARGQLGATQLQQVLPFEAVLVGELWRVTSRIGLGGDTKGKGGFRGVAMDIRRYSGEIIFFTYYPVN